VLGSNAKQYHEAGMSGSLGEEIRADGGDSYFLGNTSHGLDTVGIGRNVFVDMVKPTVVPTTADSMLIGRENLARLSTKRPAQTH
jgi:hypothetical protein